MTMWDYLDAHPVWGLVYLVILVLGFLACAAVFAEAKKKRTTGDNVREIITAIKEAANKIEVEDRSARG